MAASRHEDEVRKLVSEHGVEVRQARHGGLWSIRGKILMVPRTGDNDARTWRNALADVRRLMRSVGIEPEDTESGREADRAADTAKSNGNGVSTDQSSVIHAGIYAEPRTRSVIETLNDTIVMTDAALAILLKDVVDPIPAQAGETGRSVKIVLESNGKQLDLNSVFTIRLETTIMRESV